MRPVISSLVIAVACLAVAGCGGSTTQSVTDVERAFFQAGVPFEEEILADVRLNPYLRPPDGPPRLFLPGPLNKKKHLGHLDAILAATSEANFAVNLAFVFDSPSAASAAVRAYPLSKWVESNRPLIRLQEANVIILWGADDAEEAQRVRRAIAELGQA